MRKSMVALIALVVVAVGLIVIRGALQGDRAPQMDSVFNVAIEHWETKRGARVYFVEAPELPIVDVQIVFDAGAARDGVEHGVAQLANALLGEGTRKLNADQIAEQFEEVGAIFSQQVGRDTAIVGLRSLSERKQLNPAVELFSEVIGQPSFPEDAFAREQGRLLDALAREQERPGSIASKQFYQALYGDHPYANPVLGEMETVSALTPQDLNDFYQEYYVARNAVVAIVGDLSTRHAKRLAEDIVGKLSAGKAAPALPEVVALQGDVVQTQHPSSQTHVLIGTPSIAQGAPNYFALYVGNHILGGSSLVSKLFSEVREQRGLAYSVYSSLSPMQQAGPFVMGLQTRADQMPEAVDVLENTLEQFINEGPTAEELMLAKANLTGSFPLRLGSNQAIVSQLALIGFFNLPLDYLATFIEQVESVTAEDVQAAFAEVIVPEQLQVIQVGDIAAQG